MSLLERLTPEELDICESLFDPICLSECLFSDMDNLASFKDEFSHIRLGQLSMLSYEYLIDEDPSLSPKENFKLLEGAGNIYAFGARKHGKSLIVLVVDILLSIIHLDGWKTLFTSYDAVHIRSVLERIIPITENHPIYKMLDVHAKRSPTYFLQFRNGFVIESVNQNIMSKSPGCVDKETEILTDSGWKYFKDLTYENKVLSLDINTLKTEYSKITSIINEHYDGEMLQFENRWSNFLFTPNHSIIYKKSHKLNKNTFENINHKQIYMPSFVNWEGNSPREFIIEGVLFSKVKKKFIIPIKYWVELIAWYLAEGEMSINKCGKLVLKIGQKNKCSELEETLKNTGLHFIKKWDTFKKIYMYTLTNKIVNRYILDNYSRKKEKRIPRYFLNYSKELLKHFIKYYSYGDGTIIEDTPIEIFSSSQILIGNLQEAALKSGYRANIYESVQDITLNDYFYPDYKMYHIYLGVKDRYFTYQKNNVKRIPYKDNVYCIETEPYHSFLIRRFGKVLWTGNSQFFGHHVKKLFGEEMSFEPEKVYEKRIEATSELGCIERISGMTNFTKYSPTGKIFYDLTKRPWVVNLPQYVNPMWDDAEKKKAVRKYGGESSMGYKVFIKGEVVEDGLAVFDMERVRKCYLDDKEIKVFEIDKNSYSIFEQRLIVEPPKNASRIYICADVGESVSKNEFVLCKIDGKFICDRISNIYKLKHKKMEIFNYKDGKSVWSETSLIEHDYDGDFYDFYIFPGNHKVSVTASHSLMIFDGNTLIPKYSKDVKIGDWMLIPKEIGTNNNDIGYISLKYNRWIEPRKVYETSDISLNEDLAFLLGMAVAEGSDKDKSKSYQLAVGISKSKAEEYLLLFRKIFSYNSGYVSCHKAEKYKKYTSFYRLQDCYYTIFGGGKGVRDFFSYRVGNGCHNKKIPEEIFNSNLSVRLSFIKGLFDGDGTQYANGNETLHTTSEILANQTSILLKTCGYDVSLSEFDAYEGHSKSYYVTYNKEKRKYFSGVPIEFVYEKKDKYRMKKLREYSSEKAKNNFNRLNSLEWNFVKVKKINTYKYKDKVYDFYVPNSNTFVVGSGNILVHNTAPTEIVVFAEINNKFRYIYNIILLNLTDKQQHKVFKYLGMKLKANFISVDSTDGTGRSIYRSLAEDFGKDHMVWCHFAEKIPVDFEKDEKDNVIMKEGKPVHKEEYVSEWSIQHLKDLFYEEKLELPMDFRLDAQLNSVVSFQSTNRVVYKCIHEQDHLFQAFQVFSIAHWDTEFRNIKKITRKAFFKSGI